MLFTKPVTTTVQELLDKNAVRELIEFERFCRDNALWDEMRRCFMPGATVTVSWYQGGAAGFIDASRRMESPAPHKLNNTLVWLNEKKAVAVTMASIQIRKTINKVPCDMVSYVRFLYKTQKVDSEWFVESMDCIYEKDCLVPVLPGGFTSGSPVVRKSYSTLAAVLGAEGYPIAGDLPGDDLPETVHALLREAEGWLGSRQD